MAEVGFPVMLDLVDAPCLVVGAGRVASMKISGLLAARASITVVAPDVSQSVASLSAAGEITLEQRPYLDGEAARFVFVTTATGDADVDAKVSHDARSAGRFVNAADTPAQCTALLPSVARAGAVVISVSTTGRSPALAAWLRRRIEDLLPNDIAIAAALLGEGRQSLRDGGFSTEEVGFGDIVGDVVDLVAQGQTDQARELIAGLTPRSSI